MRTKKKIILSVIVLIITALFFCYILLSNLWQYDTILKKNWDITIPASCKIVYEKDEGESIFGDGYRYHVLSYNEALSEIQWKTEALNMERGSPSVNDILEGLNVPANERPASVDKFYMKKKNDMEVVYLLMNEEDRKIYICESFI